MLMSSHYFLLKSVIRDVRVDTHILCAVEEVCLDSTACVRPALVSSIRVELLSVREKHLTQLTKCFKGNHPMSLTNQGTNPR